MFRSTRARKLITEKTNQAIMNEILRSPTIRQGIDRSPQFIRSLE